MARTKTTHPENEGTPMGNPAMDCVVFVFRQSSRWWAACSPDFPGAHAQGRTLRSARRNLLSAIRDLHGVVLDGEGIESRPMPGVVIETIPCTVPA